MKAIKNLFASLLLLTACGSVEPGADDSGDDEPTPDAGIDPEPDAPDSDAPEADLPFLVDAPVPATVPTPLSSVTYAGGNLIQLIRPTSATAQFSVLEQRVVSSVAGPITIDVALAPPTASYSRSIASFYEAPIEAWFPVQFLCSENNVSTNDPRCSMQPPIAALANAGGEVTEARWRVYVVDASGAPVSSCVETSLHASCVLPDASGASYKIVVAADGFSQLWQPGALQQLSTLIGPMTGAHLPERVVCKHFSAEGGSSRVWCDSYDTYIGYVGNDAASIVIEPMQLTITSGTATETFTSPAITWNPGNNDLPGDPY